MEQQTVTIPVDLDVPVNLLTMDSGIEPIHDGLPFDEWNQEYLGWCATAESNVSDLSSSQCFEVTASKRPPV